MMKQKIDGVVAEAQIKYLKTAFFGDLLEISIAPQNNIGKPILMPSEIRNKFFNNVE